LKLKGKHETLLLLEALFQIILQQLHYAGKENGFKTIGIILYEESKIK
jgi:hypothetical protein